MRKSDALGALAVLTGGLLTLPGEIGMLAAAVLAIAAYWVARSGIGPGRGELTAKVEALRTLATRGR